MTIPLLGVGDSLSKVRQTINQVAAQLGTVQGLGANLANPTSLEIFNDFNLAVGSHRNIGDSVLATVDRWRLQNLVVDVFPLGDSYMSGALPGGGSSYGGVGISPTEGFPAVYKGFLSPSYARIEAGGDVGYVRTAYHEPTLKEPFFQGNTASSDPTNKDVDFHWRLIPLYYAGASSKISVGLFNISSSPGANEIPDLTGSNANNRYVILEAKAAGGSDVYWKYRYKLSTSAETTAYTTVARPDYVAPDINATSSWQNVVMSYRQASGLTVYINGVSVLNIPAATWNTGRSAGRINMVPVTISQPNSGVNNTVNSRIDYFYFKDLTPNLRPFYQPPV